MGNKTDMAERTIVDIGKYLQRFGLNIGEHPQFGGVGKGHSPTGYHPTGEAIDVRDWRPDVAPAYEGGKPISWKQRTGELAWRAKQLGIFNEALGPGDKGHDTHVHLALAGKKYIPENQLKWLVTGRWEKQKPDGGVELSSEMPIVSQPVSSENAGSVSEVNALAGLFGGLLNMMPKQKTLQEQLMETAISSALTPKKPSTSALLQLARSGPLDEIIYG